MEKYTALEQAVRDPSLAIITENITTLKVLRGELREEETAFYFRCFLLSDGAVGSAASRSRRNNGTFSSPCFRASDHLVL